MSQTDKILKTAKEGRKIHPQKFAMWLAIGSISMMFAGFTSAVIVRQAQGNWIELKLSPFFYISTVVIILSSLSMWLTVRSFKHRNMLFHKRMVIVTVIFGLLFAVLQFFGFREMMAQTFWSNNVSVQFIVVIVLVHVVHVIGGVVALAIMFFRTFNRKVKRYSMVGLELISTYWHFVDILWIYLFLFFIYIA